MAKAFAKGYDPRRNIAGRPPKGRCISDILRRIGEERLPPDLRNGLLKRFPDMTKDETFVNALARVVYNYALKGEAWAVQCIFDRCFGKVRDEVEFVNAGPMVVFPQPKKTEEITNGQ
jgi:hypothetical protein